MRKFLFLYRYHFLYWLSFGIYEVISVAVVTGSFGRLRNYIFHYLLNIVLFYSHAEITLPALNIKGKNRHLVLTLLVTAQVFIYLFMSYLLDGLLGSKVISVKGLLSMRWSFILSTLWRAVYFMGFATTYYFFLQFRSQQRRSLDLERLGKQKVLIEKQMALELADARNDYLRAQINPHFLMNTLSFIYNSTHKTEPHSAQAVFYLSKLLRYITETEHGPRISRLGLEIEQVENLLHLCRIRNNELYLDFYYQAEMEDIETIPLLLLTLSENMIKHGNLSEPDKPGTISISGDGGQVVIETVNLINTGINDTGMHSGIKNLRQRLAHQYQEKASLEYYYKDPGYFTARVIVPSQNSVP